MKVIKAPLLLWSVLVVLTYACQQVPVSKTETNQDEAVKVVPYFERSDKPPFQVPKEQAYEFGYLNVPENRPMDFTKIIKLPVYILKSRSDNPKPDPVIWLTGGPGNSIMNAAPYAKYFEYLDDRDLILIEQRGVQYAQPHLDCPEWAAAVYEAGQLELTTKNVFEKQAEVDEILAIAARACKERLESAGIDLEGYHTKEIAADVNDLVKVLKIEKYNLLTVSYGTKIAQQLMKDHPKRIRSVVLDGPLPLEASYDEESLANLIETYKTLFADCRNDEACNAAFPDLQKRFFTFLEQITGEPLELDVPIGNKGQERKFFLRGKDVGMLLSNLGTAQMPQVPYLIDEILKGNYELLKSELSGLSAGNGRGRGMRLSVWCAEEIPFTSEEKIKKESQQYAGFKGASPAVFSHEICNIWGVKAVNSSANQPVKSSIPTLIMNGSYDPETPVKWGQQMSRNLPNSFHLIFEGFHHSITTYWDNPCGMRVANAFFNQPERSPELPCFKEIGKPDFKVE